MRGAVRHLLVGALQWQSSYRNDRARAVRQALPSRSIDLSTMNQWAPPASASLNAAAALEQKKRVPGAAPDETVIREAGASGQKDQLNPVNRSGYSVSSVHRTPLHRDDVTFTATA